MKVQIILIAQRKTLHTRIGSVLNPLLAVGTHLLAKSMATKYDLDPNGVRREAVTESVHIYSQESQGLFWNRWGRCPH